MLKYIKNFGIFMLKIICIIFFFYFVFSACYSYIMRILMDYDYYFMVRGMENYGEPVMGSYVSEETIGGKHYYIYEYVVDDEIYEIESLKKYNDEDKTISLLYDSLQPEIAVTSIELVEIDSFYTNCMKKAVIVYIELIMGVIILGIVWFLLDLLKYDKKLWKQYT